MAKVVSPSGVVHVTREFDPERSECGWWTAGWKVSHAKVTCQICLNKTSLPKRKASSWASL